MKYLIFKCEKWQDFIIHARYFIGWGFRGHSDSKWYPKTAIERFAENFSFPFDDLANRESWILHNFKRRAEHYINNPPSPDSNIEWLALLQHYGGPTRLLDFTFSQYVAAFFAMEKANGDAAVWCINIQKLNEILENRLKKCNHIDEIRRLNLDLAEKFITSNCLESGLLFIEPTRLNERISVQNGCFIFPTNITKSFLENLCSFFKIQKKEIENCNSNIRYLNRLTPADVLDSCIIKIILPKEIHKNAMFDLAKMNVSAVTLFPGLDGFARSLLLHMRIKDISNHLV